MLYRTHKSLPNSQKVSSLYVFDALARAAKHQANKRSLPIKEISSDKPGNAGTFLFKLEGILDGLVEDMVAIGTPEATVCIFRHEISLVGTGYVFETLNYRKRLEKYWKSGQKQIRFPLMYCLAWCSLSTQEDKVLIRFQMFFLPDLLCNVTIINPLCPTSRLSFFLSGIGPKTENKSLILHSFSPSSGTC